MNKDLKRLLADEYTKNFGEHKLWFFQDDPVSLVNAENILKAKNIPYKITSVQVDISVGFFGDKYETNCDTFEGVICVFENASDMLLFKLSCTDENSI